MTDKKNEPGDPPVDWDSALEEWDSKTFVPEVAKDAETDKPAALAGSASKALYRPPVPAAGAPPRPAPPRPGAPPPAAPRAVAPLPPARPPVASEPPVELDELDDDDDGESNATVIAAIPRELLRGAGKVDEDAPVSSGGLGQLFAKSPDEAAEEIDILVAQSSGKITSRPPPIVGVKGDDEPEPSFVTSAKHVAPTREQLAAAAERLRRPSLADVQEKLSADGSFDPFADPVTRAIARPAGAAPLAPPPPPREMMPTPVGFGGEIDTFRGADAPETTGSAPPALPTEDDALDALLASDAEEPPSGPSLHAPQAREFDPNDETFVATKASLAAKAPRAPSGDIDLVGVGEEDDDVLSTRVRSREEASGADLVERRWTDEAPASMRLDDPMRNAFDSRATWLEEEAREVADKATRARGLLAASELRAILGDAEAAWTLASEARDLAPSLVMAHRQARALIAEPRDPEQVANALDLEARHSSVPSAKLHATLLAADTLRLAGDDDGATKRYDAAFRASPSDPRAPVLRAARALARGETASAAYRMPDGPELAPFAVAISQALRLRGVERESAATKRAPGDAVATASPNDTLRRARAAVAASDSAGAAALVADLRDIPEIARGATWLASALGATRRSSRAEAARLVDSLAGKDGALALRTVAARALELGDSSLLTTALRDDTRFSPAERAVLTTFANPEVGAAPRDLDQLLGTDGMAPLGAALAAVTPSRSGLEDREASVQTRANRVAGTTSRSLVRLARLMAAGAEASAIEKAMGPAEGTPNAQQLAVALEMAVRGERFAEVSDKIADWPSDDADGARDRNLGAAIVAERANDTPRALAKYRKAHATDATSELAMRAAASLDPGADLVVDLNALADELVTGPRAAAARLEAVARSEADDSDSKLPDATRADLLEKAHRAAPTLPIASFLAEHLARRAGDVEMVLRWVRERRSASEDPLESALDSVREALLVADKDPALACERLEEAHRARPSDIALREMYERVASEPPADRASWRERRAAETTGDARALLFLEAAHEYERTGDKTAALRCAEAAATSGSVALGRLARERAELEAGQVARFADELLTLAKTTEDPIQRREAYERLAVVDAIGRDDTASALLWHRSILEESPTHLASLRYLEQALVTDGRDDELESIAAGIAKALATTDPAEASSHAQLGARLRLRGAEGAWDATRDLVEIAAAQPNASLWALRMLHAHARARGDDAALLDATARLLERITRPAESASLLVRAGEAASRLGDLPRARDLLERAASEDPADVVTWGLLADVRQKAGDARGAAEACESLARTSVVAEHQLLAWYDAGRIWLDDAKDDERATIALEQAAAIDVTFGETFQRLSSLYAGRRASSELANLLERRIARASDPDERIQLLVDQGRALVEAEDYSGARAAFETALAEKPDDPAALGALAEQCAREQDWDGAEHAWVRLARLLPSPEEQRDVYWRLGDLYATHLLNLARAEVAFKEVLKRSPEDVPATERLVDVYKRQNDSVRAVELQQELIAKATDADTKKKRLIELSSIFESTGHDNRKAEQALEGARREFPMDVSVLRALAEFYTRHKQMPAVNILLDRVSGDARRAFAAGRFVPPLFEMMQAVYELRGKKDAARTVGATLAALEGRPAEIRGGEARALDPRLDDSIAPETLSSAVRSLLARTGDALDVASPMDLKKLRAAPLPPAAGPLGGMIAQIAASIGLPSVQAYASPVAGLACLPIASSPPAIVLGDGLIASSNATAQRFLVFRALKLVLSRASALVRTPPADLAVLIGAWLQIFNPTWKPQGINATALSEVGKRISSALPRGLAADVGVLALEVAGALGTSSATFGASAISWANRSALLAIGDPSAALDAIAMSQGLPNGAPTDPKERATWIARTQEAKDLIGFSVSDAYGELRARLGVGG
jgi:hypothetical protein